MAANQVTRLKEIYCPYCHLSTRTDHERCVHCRKPIRPRLETPRAGRGS